MKELNSDENSKGKLDYCMRICRTFTRGDVDQLYSVSTHKKKWSRANHLKSMARESSVGHGSYS